MLHNSLSIPTHWSWKTTVWHSLQLTLDFNFVYHTQHSLLWFQWFFFYHSECFFFANNILKNSIVILLCIRNLGLLLIWRMMMMFDMPYCTHFQSPASTQIATKKTEMFFKCTLILSTLSIFSLSFWWGLEKECHSHHCWSLLINNIIILLHIAIQSSQITNDLILINLLWYYYYPPLCC